MQHETILKDFFKAEGVEASPELIEASYQLTAYERVGFIDAKEAVVSILADALKANRYNLDVSAIVSAYNDMKEQGKYYDDVLMNIEMFDDEMCGLSPLEIVAKVHDSDGDRKHFRPSDDYYRYDGYGLAYSMDRHEVMSEILDEAEELAAFLYENGAIEGNNEGLGLDDWACLIATDAEALENAVKGALRLVELGY